MFNKSFFIVSILIIALIGLINISQYKTENKVSYEILKKDIKFYGINLKSDHLKYDQDDNVLKNAAHFWGISKDLINNL